MGFGDVPIEIADYDAVTIIWGPSLNDIFSHSRKGCDE